MNSFHLELHPGAEYISDYIRKYGCWEPITTEVLIEVFNARKPNTVFVDIGANIGYFSFLAAQQGIQVVAFEPVATNYGLFTKSIAINNYHKLVKTFMVPLSDKKR